METSTTKNCPSRHALVIRASVEIPSVLLASADYSALNDQQRRNFLARLHHLEEVAEKAIDATQIQGFDFLGVVDDIELDVLSILSGFGEVSSTVSIYTVHSSWTFECDHGAMAALVPLDAADFLAQPPIGLQASEEEAVAWMELWGNTLLKVLDCLSVATSYTAAVTYLITIDALVASHVQFAACVRLRRQ
jgi:hypothetical protein